MVKLSLKQLLLVSGCFIATASIALVMVVSQATARTRTKPEALKNMIISGMQSCQFNQYTQAKCLNSLASQLMRKATHTTILTALAQNESQPVVFSKCHELTHYIGRDAYDETHNIQALYRSHDTVCHGGFYHGVIEEYFNKLGMDWTKDSPAVQANVRSVCGQQADYTTPWYYSECIHGIGHAMMFITNMDLPASLAFCDSLSQSSDYLTCYGGVFMENSSSSTTTGHISKYVSKAGDPNFPCSQLKTQYLATCYQYQSSYFSEISNYDWSHTAALCDGVPIDYRSGCYNIIGSNTVGFTEDTQHQVGICTSLAQKNYLPYCYSGILSALAGRYLGDGSKMLAVCQMVSESYKTGCYDGIGMNTGAWDRNGHMRQSVCGEIADPRYRNICLNPGTTA